VTSKPTHRKGFFTKLEPDKYQKKKLFSREKKHQKKKMPQKRACRGHNHEIGTESRH